MSKTFLYRHWGDKDILLYIGITNNCAARTDNHERAAAWYNKITRITVEPFSSRTAAAKAEKKAILKEQPIYNSTHKKKRAKPKPRNLSKSKPKVTVSLRMSVEMHQKIIELADLGTRSPNGQILHLLDRQLEE